MMVEEKISDKDVGAWFKARDIDEIRRIFGEAAAQYLRFPRRVSRIEKTVKGVPWVQFATLGDSEPSVSQTGEKGTQRPIWDPHWLVKVKGASNINGKKFKVSPVWKDQVKYRMRFASEAQARWFKPEFSNEEVTAEHASFSGHSYWVRNKSGFLACIPTSYLSEIKEFSGTDDELKKFVEQNFKEPKSFSESQYQNQCCQYQNPCCEVSLDLVPEKEDNQMEILITEKEDKMISNSNSMSINSPSDARIRLLESKIGELMSEKDEAEFYDPENDLDNSMVLDLPPEIAEWAKEAGVGLEDMLPLAEKICSIQADQNKAIAKYSAMVNRAEARSEADKEFIEYEAESATIQNQHNKEYLESVSAYRHETIQTFLKWGSVAGTVSYIAYNLSVLFA